jgi:hypothetical protein
VGFLTSHGTFIARADIIDKRWYSLPACPHLERFEP